MHFEIFLAAGVEKENELSISRKSSTLYEVKCAIIELPDNDWKEEKEMIFLDKTDRLTNEVIAAWVKDAESACRQASKDRMENATSFRLALEEILLRFRDEFGTEEECRLKGVRNTAGIRFEISLQGPPRNPLAVSTDEELPYELLSHLNIKPTYAYQEKRSLNLVTYQVALKPRKNGMLIHLGYALVLAVLTYLLSRLLPGSVKEGYLIPLIAGLFGKLSSVFSALATPLIFCAVISGIGGLGDVNSIGKLGATLIRRMMVTYLIAAAAMVLFGLPFGLVSTHAAAAGENVFADILTVVLDIIPGNLVEPFRVDNDLQVIVIAIFVGIIMLILGSRVQRIREILDEGGALINRMMMAVCKLLPLFVYLGITNILLSDRLSQISSVITVFVITLAGAAVTIGITTIRTRIVTGRPLSWIVKAQIPSLLINLTTSSQVSAMPESMKCCKDKWHINEKMVDFGLPFGIVVYMPNGAIMLGATAWVLSVIATGPVDVTTLVKLALVSIIVAIAAPPIPGSAFAVLPILFSACGTDASMMPLAIVVGSTVGYLLPAMNGYCLQQELLMTACKTGNISPEET